jgi:Lrp/AsnC family leucine-responsive transcriptional regulator
VHLDPTDLRLLNLLQADASLSNQDLAAAAHTSPATALRRVRRLVDAGVIERQVALLNPERIGRGLSALIEITLDRQGAEHLDAFEQRIVSDAEVQQRLFTQDANVRNVKAYFAVKRAKFDPRVNLVKPA